MKAQRPRVGYSCDAVVSLPGVIRLDAATVLLQWAVGGLAFLWFTTRRREVGLGYGWLLRGIYLLMAVSSALVRAALRARCRSARSAPLAVAASALFALIVSIVRRRAGVSGQTDEHDRRSRAGRRDDRHRAQRRRSAARRARVPAGCSTSSPRASASSGWSPRPSMPAATSAVSLLRTFAGAAFLGAVTDAMLLGHWYLVQPGLPRRHLNELVRALGWVWPVEVVALLLPTGMVSVWTGAVDDGWNGTLGWFWAACAVTTIVLVFVTKAALRERYYSAVMAATGLLYLAILTAFGTDLVARAVLAG